LDVQIREHQDGDVDTYKSALNGYKALGQIQSHAVENMDAAVALIMHRTQQSPMKMADVIKLSIEFSGATSGCLYSQLHPKTIAENARSLDVGKQYGVRILQRYMGWSNEKAVTVVHQLVYEYPSHSFIIDREELSQLGFPVESPEGDLENILEMAGVALELRKPPLNGQEVKFFPFTAPQVPPVNAANGASVVAANTSAQSDTQRTKVKTRRV
jgi:hypothetical protein